MRIFLVAAMILGMASALPAQEPPSGGSMLNLSCMEALSAVQAGWLSGVFTFIPEKDSTLAFADMVVRNKLIRRKYVAKLMRDHAAARGITVWDHEVVMHILGIYSSPLASLLEKPDPTTSDRLNMLGLAPTMTLAEMNARRPK